MPAHQMLLSCDSVLSSESPWTLSSKETKDAQATECACYSPTTKRRESLSLSDNGSSADTRSLSSNNTGSPEENEATDDEDVAVCENEAHADAAPIAEQSPIDICHTQCAVVPRATLADSISITTGASNAELHYSGRGFHVYWNGPLANTLTIAGKIYHAVQFHFHTPSEHTLDGDHEEMELHLVHQAADGSLAVVGIFFREGKQNPFLAQFWDELSGLNVGEANEIQVGMVDTKPLELLSGSFYRYRGSLTTPPYSEGVEWVVVRDIAQASREQLDAFRQVLPGTNARDVQPLNKRDVALVH